MDFERKTTIPEHESGPIYALIYYYEPQPNQNATNFDRNVQIIDPETPQPTVLTSCYIDIPIPNQAVTQAYNSSDAKRIYFFLTVPPFIIYPLPFS